ncbi:uncharacterized protein TRUGW13939_04627 [Talaromyces rugulosus]|uniref:Protein kinase domain-containing protein n=1 Tax=Talaromyces rugulosus TaxID=121627 RepID=A0A7H8QXJ7_TALRU|nr:uncharacterized protein TRUGW13939_04627 [Talaromyces rugulosus]QKX57513.1 hypothetical protein TRUGW13939_04627 [Talaromyces rugulosus]
MATEASPTPASAAYRTGGVQRPMSRQLSRSSLLRTNSGRASPDIRNGSSHSGRSTGSKQYEGDSSDDEVVPEPKFSASVKALLEGDAMHVDSSPRYDTNMKRSSVASRDFGLAPATSARPERHVRVASPHDSSGGSPAPRVVRVGSVRIQSRPESVYSEGQSYSKDFITPAPRTRSVRITGSRSTTRSPLSNSPIHKATEKELSGDHKEFDLSGDEKPPRMEDEFAPRLGPSSVLRSRHGDEPGMHSSLRVKRVGRLTGSFLNGPARRGVLRRQSEEISEHPEADSQSPERPERNPSHNPREENGSASRLSRVASSSKLSWIDSDPRILEKPAPASAKPNIDAPFSGPPSPRSYRTKSTPGTSSEGSLKSESAKEQPQYRVPPPVLPSAQDQENDPPPTFKRVKSSGLSLLDKPEKYAVIYDDDKKEQEQEPPATNSPRKPLTSRSNNTPRRPAPPPPKMSVLETATGTGGAATTASQSRKKRSQVVINHKAFTRMDCVGRGGTSRVYRVMAENYKIFALKRVNLEDVDRVTLAGYKGEIDLLKKLENVERVVRLFDWEINSDKHTLSILMEIGESDLDRILTYRLNAEDAVFDPSFTRYYWKEMLECVQAVHNFNIVHSDLKPANFLLVQGRLKLIDFGIANAIQDDTVNVHREQQVGTPNYMSPEALIDSNAALGLPASVGKMMKLGKPSDVWSLGCILYKMVYGQPPFARIAKYYERIMSIPNPKVAIEFPQFAIGGVTVPFGLMRTMKRCLQRDPSLRPTMDELLSERDPFLYPDSQLEGTVPVTQEMISRILTNVVHHCRVRGVPKDEELAAWPAGFFAKIKAAVDEDQNDHITELNNTRPKQPFFFLKPSSSILLPGHGPVLRPKGVNMHYEVELGLVIGKTVRDLDPEDHKTALDSIANYVLAIDMTARNVQDEAKKKGLPWSIAKGFDTFCPISELIPKSAIPDPHNAFLRLSVGDAVRQADSTNLMLYQIPRQLADISRVMTLEAGDLVLTGTPKGVGQVQAGDVMRAEIEVDGKKIEGIEVEVKDRLEGRYEFKET